MSEHPDRPAFDPGAGPAPATWPGTASDAQRRMPTAALPTTAADFPAPTPPPPGYPPAAASTPPSAYPPPSGGIFAPTYAVPTYAPAVVPNTPPPGTRPGPRWGLMVALAAVVGLIAGLLGGGLGSVLVNRGIAVVQGQSPVPPPLPGVTARPDGSIAKIAATALPSVVTVKIKTSDVSGNGSGFVIDRAGHILTNNHVVAGATGAGEISVEFVDGTSLPARIVGRDSSYDLAVLAVDKSDLTPLEWGRSADVVVGDGVIAVGAPLGLDATVTSGIVSALNRPVAAGGGDATSFINAIQTDAAINPGNSGGPLLDMSGRVIGINSAIARDPGSTSSVGGSIGVGFAIPSDQAVKTAQQLIATGKAEHPIIGVKLDTQFTGEGARIVDPGGVSAGSAAQSAGLRDGDIVVKFEGKKVAGPDQLVVAIRAKSVGDTVHLTVERAGASVDLTLTLQASN